MFHSFKNTVPDPDLEIRGGGRGGGLSPPKIFRPLGPHFGPKIKGGVGRVPLGLSPGSATEITLWVSDNQLIDLTSASVLSNSVLKNYMAFERIIST